MNKKPDACKGCPLYDIGEGFMASPQTGLNGVMLVGEALGEEESRTGEPFVGRAGKLLTNLISRAGLSREGFSIANAVWCRPPNNKLEGMPYERGAVAHCKQAHLEPMLARVRPRVIVPMGNVALSSLCGTKGILEHRGYVSWDSFKIAWILPTVHPSYIMRGNGNYGGVLMHDLGRAVHIARNGWGEATKNYLIDPSPQQAMSWADQFMVVMKRNPSIKLSFDIETPGKKDDEGEG